MSDEHDAQCESEFIVGPMAYSPCGCNGRRVVEDVIAGVLTSQGFEPVSWAHEAAAAVVAAVRAMTVEQRADLMRAHVTVDPFLGEAHLVVPWDPS